MSDFLIKAPSSVEIKEMSIQDIKDYISALTEFLTSHELKTMCHPNERVNKSMMILDEIMRWQSYLKSQFEL